MFLRVVSTNTKLPVVIEQVVETDFKNITKKRYSFNWKIEKGRTIYKLKLKHETDILGLMSLTFYENEQRIEINLLAVVKEQIGINKKLDGIAGNLIAYAAKKAINCFGAFAAISLIPKTELKLHYIQKYGFENAGISLFMEGDKLLKIIKEYNYD
jgi:hypothetical protein